jgi:6-hydroxytryprostatin B O-methyltransferase
MCDQFLLQQTAADAVKNAIIVSEHYHHQPLDSPGCQQSSQNVTRAKAALLEAASRIQQLVMDPSDFLSHTVVQQQQFSCLHWLTHFRIPFHVPLAPESLSYQEVAQRAKVPERLLRSVARMSMTTGFFRETAEGKIAHTSLSASVVANPDIYNWIMYMATRTVPTMSKFVEATELWGETTKKNQTAYSLAMKTDLSLFEHLSSQRELAEEFSAYMKSQASSSGTSVAFLLQGFDWASLGNAVVVDVCAILLPCIRRLWSLTHMYRSAVAGVMHPSLWPSHMQTCLLLSRT